MCKMTNVFVLDLFNNTSTGGIEFNVANSLPQLMNTPCKIVVKQVLTEIVNSLAVGTATIDNLLYFRVVHNMNIQSGTNKSGFSNSNVLCFFDTFKFRTIATDNTIAATETECVLYAPNGLPAIMTLNRWGALNVVYPLTPVDLVADNPALSWNIRLEITINPDQE